MTFDSFGINGIGNTKNEENEFDISVVRRSKDLQKLADEALNKIIDSTDINPEKTDSLQKKNILDETLGTINEILDKNKTHLSLGDKQKTAYYVMDEIFGYGPITKLLNDPTVSEVMVNGADNVYVEKAGKIERTEITFRDDRHVMNTIEKIITPLGRRVDESSPMVDARLPDGSRVNIIIPPLAIKGPTITIRKFAADPFTLEDLISFGTLNHDMSTFLRACVRGKINIVVSGGTGSGKTTLLNVISSFIPHNERIITIEDAAELQLQQKHVVTLESRPANIEGKGKINVRDLVVNSLRMRPDRIIVGEVRSAEALDMLQAMNTGHDGSITTVHANSPRDTLSRLETMVMMSEMELPSRAIREQISSAINMVIHVARFLDGTRKIVNISEITGMEGETITLQDIFVYKQEGFNERGQVTGKHIPTGIVPGFIKKIKARGEILPASVFKSPLHDLSGRP
ncbi:MAG: CpaF family protein [Bacillota bacterium]|nr:CpaF family protein [Bacillota bacterium]